MYGMYIIPVNMFGVVNKLNSKLILIGAYIVTGGGSGVERVYLSPRCTYGLLITHPPITKVDKHQWLLWQVPIIKLE